MLQEEIAKIADLIEGDAFLEIQCPGYIHFFNLATMARISSAVSVTFNGAGYILNFMIETCDESVQASLPIKGRVFKHESSENISAIDAGVIARETYKFSK